MKAAKIIIVVLPALIGLGFFAGPKVPEPVYTTPLPAYNNSLTDFDQRIAQEEASYPTRQDNEARIVWQRATPVVTEYAMVYLHGFGGSYRDGYPVNQQVADTLHANSYYARWGAHGLQPPHGMVGFTADSAWEDAKNSLAIGKAIGKKVIIISTSTGGTLALKLAAEFPEDVHAIVNISPNIKDDMPGAWLLNTPWGAEIAALIGFGDGLRKVTHEEPAANEYFDTVFVASALVDLQNLVATTMQEATYRKVKCPVLTLYYYKNGMNEDERVEVDVYDEVHAALGTPPEKKVLKSMPTPGTHFMGCEIKSRDTESVRREILTFLEEQMIVATQVTAVR